MGGYFGAGWFFRENDTSLLLFGLNAFLFFPLAWYAGVRENRCTQEALLRCLGDREHLGQQTASLDGCAVGRCIPFHRDRRADGRHGER